MFTENRAFIQEFDSKLRDSGMSIESAAKLLNWSSTRIQVIFDDPGQLTMEERCQIIELKAV